MLCDAQGKSVEGRPPVRYIRFMACRVSIPDAADVSAFHMEYDRHTAMRAQIPVTVNDLYRKQLILRSLIQTGNFQMIGFLCRPVDFPGCPSCPFL